MPTTQANYNDRLATLVTLILSLFAFLSYARTALPAVPVCTWMDSIIFKSTLSKNDQRP